MAINLLREQGVSFTTRSLDHSPEILQEIRSHHNRDTTPVIFDTTNGQNKLVGGYTDLQEYLASGKQLLRG